MGCNANYLRNNFVDHGTPPCSNEELFFTEKRKRGPHKKKDFGGRYGYPGFFIGFSVSTTGLESFSLRPKKLSK